MTKSDLFFLTVIAINIPLPFFYNTVSKADILHGAAGWTAALILAGGMVFTFKKW